MSEPPIDRRYEDAAERQALEADNERLREAIYWALGERDEFPEEPPPLNGKWRQRYWWRRELRRRAFDVDDNGADQPTPVLGMSLDETRFQAALGMVGMMYPPDVFPPNGKSQDSKSAAMVRLTLENVWREYEKLKEAERAADNGSQPNGDGGKNTNRRRP